ncbi:hypothetical protein LXL04_009002 [Taraxacum kok-saghyz]
MFSVRSMRNLWEASYLKDLPYKHWWNNWIPLKINFFGWRAVLNRLPTKLELAKRGVPIPSAYCRFCGQMEEDDSHLFLQCTWIKEVWERWSTWSELDLEGTHKVEQLLNLTHSTCQSTKQKKLIHAVTLVTLWTIWKARNDQIFNNRRTTPCRIIEEIKAQSFLWIKNRGREIQMNWNTWCIFPFAVH